MGLRKILLGALVASCAIALASEDAQAFWGSRGGWGSYGGSWGSGGSSGSSGSYGSGGSYGSSGSWGSNGSSGSWGGRGSHGGLFHRHHRRGSWGSGGSYGSNGSSGSWGSNGSSGSHGSSGSAGGYAYGGYGGEVVVDEGYVSNDVAPVKTKLTLNVPANAKVTLAGAPTKQTGETREFSTTKLAAGQAWNDYVVHVEMNVDGKVVSQDRRISLTGGTTQELTIDLDAGQQLARVN